MPKNSESLNRSLFELLQSKGFDPTMLDTSGKEIPTPEEAEVFQFNFIKDGEDYGKVTISIDGMHKLCIYFSDEVADSEKEETHGEDESWYKVLNQLKRFAQKYQLSFELKNVDHLKHDMAKREYMKKQERISEGYYPMGKKASYNDAVPNVKIVIQHTRQIEEGEQRYRNIAKIFLENSEGERFLAPTIKPGVARVYGRLIAEGDKPHGERWNHVTSLVEEYQKMGAFVRATRNGQFNESAQRLVNEGINHYQGLRETLSRMTGHRGYNTYFESWTPSLMEDETEENNLNELFVQETLDPRIESVMPILNKLQKKVAEMKEVGELSEWADSLTEAPGAETLGHNVRTDAKNLKAFDLEEDDMDEGAAVDAYMAGKSPALAHFADKLDNEIDEGFDDIDDPVVSSITRRIIRQHPELLKHGPDKVLAAIADVADFVGDVEEIGSSDVSGWVKQVARQLNGVDEGMFDKVKDAVKTVGGKVLNKLGHDDDTELLKKIQKDAGIPASAQHGKPSMAKQHDDEDIIEGQQLSIQQLATISDEALDNAYKYGRSTPGNSFGWQANLKSAQYAKQMIDKGVTDIEAISDAIHKGWNVTAQAFVQKPEQFDDTAKLQANGKLEAKLQQRAELMKKNYAQLPEDEKEKDRVVARALLQAIKGDQGVEEGYVPINKYKGPSSTSYITKPKSDGIGSRLLNKAKEKINTMKGLDPSGHKIQSYEWNSKDNIKNLPPELYWQDQYVKVTNYDIPQAQNVSKNKVDTDYYVKHATKIKELLASYGIEVPDIENRSAILNRKPVRLQEDDIEESALQASFGIKKYGKKGMEKLRAAGKKHASEKTMQNIRAEYSDKEKPVAEEVDTGQYDAVKSSPKGDNDQNWDKPFREKIKQYAKELEKRQKEKEQGVAESEFAGDYATGEAGQWRNKGPKAHKPATIGDLVGEGQDDLDTIRRLLKK
jgi:hypothetical protein